MFNGGSVRTKKEGVRVASLRGAMRFWFRALAGAATGPSLTSLAALERRALGGAGTPSPAALRIPVQPPCLGPTARHTFLPAASRPVEERRRHSGRLIVYLLGQDLGDLAECAIQRPYVEPGRKFELKLRFNHLRTDPPDVRTAIEALTFASLWLACAYGGVGARARRGFGGLRIIGADGPLPDPWSGTSILTPALGHYEALTCLWPDGEAELCLAHLATLAEATDQKLGALDEWDNPTYPVLSQRHTAASATAQRFRTWEQTLIRAGEQWRRFRATKDYPAARYEPQIKTPEWDDVINDGRSDHFALGALGLPVGYKDKKVVHAGRPGQQPLRRASPLWLRPVGTGETWRLLSFAFLGEFLPGPDAPGVYLWEGSHQGRRLTVEDADVKSRTAKWIDAMRTGQSF